MVALDPIPRALEDVRQMFAADTSGALPDYIPELSAVDPNLFGISLASLEGRIYSAGDRGHLRNVRLFGRVAAPGRVTGQERCLGRADRRQAGPVRGWLVQSAAR